MRDQNGAGGGGGGNPKPSPKKIFNELHVNLLHYIYSKNENTLLALKCTIDHVKENNRMCITTARERALKIPSG